MTLAWAAGGFYLLIMAVIVVAIRWNHQRLLQRHRPVWNQDHTKVIGQIADVHQDASGITIETQMDRGPEWDAIMQNAYKDLSIGRHSSTVPQPSVLDIDALSAEEIGRWVRGAEWHAKQVEERIEQEQERLRSRSWLHAMRAVMGAEATAWEQAAEAGARPREPQSFVAGPSLLPVAAYRVTAHDPTNGRQVTDVVSRVLADLRGEGRAGPWQEAQDFILAVLGRGRGEYEGVEWAIEELVWTPDRNGWCAAPTPAEPEPEPQ